MKTHLLALSIFSFNLLALSACQTTAPTTATAEVVNQSEDIDSDVCVGDPVLVQEGDQELDLEAIARQADCP